MAFGEDRKYQPKGGDPFVMEFPKKQEDPNTWSREVRLFRINPQTGAATYKYVMHSFEPLDGQLPIKRDDGTTLPRDRQQFTYCLGSPKNPYDGKDVVVNQEGIDECRSIVLPDGCPLHDVDQGGTLWECCLCWDYTTNHMEVIRRKATFFDNLHLWASTTVKQDPFYYDQARPGYDIIITTPKQGALYRYAYNVWPGREDRLSVVMGLIKAQLKEAKEKLNPAMTKEAIYDRLGLVPRDAIDFDGVGEVHGKKLEDDLEEDLDREDPL